jgi:hypothetical protein
VNAPAVVIRIPLEGRPLAYFDTLHEGERDRLLDWLSAHPELEDLVARAVRLMDEERAA